MTERKQAEKAIRLRDERFALLSRATNDVIWDWDLETDAIWWNEALTTLFGYTRTRPKWHRPPGPTVSTGRPRADR